MNITRVLAITVLWLVATVAPALAQQSSSSSDGMSPLESVCTQYGRLLTAYVAPTAVMGTQEYRHYFFPARDECMTRGGPQFMPNGYAASPYFRPGPVASPGGGQSPGNTGSTPANPAPPPAPPPVAGNPPRPPSTPTPPVAPPRPTQAQMAAMAQRYVPAGYTLPQAVRAAMAECEIAAINAANSYPNPNLTDAQWRTIAYQTERSCAAQGGTINGRPTNSAVLAKALAVAMDGSYACEVIDDGTVVVTGAARATAGRPWSPSTRPPSTTATAACRACSPRRAT